MVIIAPTMVPVVSPLNNRASHTGATDWEALYTRRTGSDSLVPPLPHCWYMSGHNLSEACADKFTVVDWNYH